MATSTPDTNGRMEVPRARLGIGGRLAVGWLALVTTMALLPGMFPVPGVTERFREPIIEGDLGPRAGHLLGFDPSGHDVAAKIVHGARPSLLVGVLAVAIGVTFGGSLGIVAGYFRGKVDAVIGAVFDAMLAFPQAVFTLTLVTVFATAEDTSYLRRLVIVTVAIGAGAIPILGRVTRANTMSWASREFVLAAETAGATPARVIRREILPNVAPAVASMALITLAVAIVLEGALSLLGVGIPPNIDTPSWGNMIATGRTQALLGDRHLVIAPAVMILGTVLACNHLGDLARARSDARDSIL